MSRPTPGKIICVGRNYAAHARELGNEVPQRPLLFFKPPSAVIADGEAIRLPVASQRVDHEAEIALIIGRRAHRLAPDTAMAHVTGIACANDVSARDLQQLDGQWARAKGFDTFCPLGEIVRDGFAWDDLEIVGRVNGEVRQHGHVRDLIFGFPVLIAYISAIMTLEPGDVILTGTPEGVGPLAPGDVVQVEIPGVATLSNPVVTDDP
jgi:2-keto-4-pentenoate hydratase/2-oxohepta-3-ene-1,7-dioic acid hydratase in catechol pathway